MKVGFQGLTNSYSELAASRLLEQYGIDDYQLCPLISSEDVARHLTSGDINLGVVAIQNTIGGIVKETYEAFFSEDWDVKHRYILKIEHCLFVKNNSINLEQISTVASHIQALKQCKNYIREHIGNIELKEMADTALSAEALANGKLSENTAIICSKAAGLALGLHLVGQSVQDREDNSTEFILVERKQVKSSKFADITKKLRIWLFNDSFFSNVVKVAVSAIVLATFQIQMLNNLFLPKSFEMTAEQALLFSAGLSIGLISFLNKLRARQSLNLIAGHWVYLDVVNKANASTDIDYALPRAVKIDILEDNKLRIRGWICNKVKAPERYFEAKEILHSDFYKNTGSLVYKYSNFIGGKDWNFNGIVELEWNRSNPEMPISNLFGRYCGFLTNTTGSVNFKRISPEKFKEICPITED
ncbi:prephenate dehydratase [Thalassotalea sp. PLHSN55]|uniref:prephenate dehydratase n=1 Tax=Thalassotalea sp. PLHSN55 TaxID=3435888 RepID=UPI003F84EF5A